MDCGCTGSCYVLHYVHFNRNFCSSRNKRNISGAYTDGGTEGERQRGAYSKDRGLLQGSAASRNEGVAFVSVRGNA